jgi:hypothetical protein
VDVGSTRDLRMCLPGRHTTVARLAPDITPTGQHEAANEVVDFMFDEARALTQVHRFGQIRLEAWRFHIEPGIQRAAPDVQSSGGLTDGDDPQCGRRISVQVRTSKLLPRCAP